MKGKSIVLVGALGFGLAWSGACKDTPGPEGEVPVLPPVAPGTARA